MAMADASFFADSWEVCQTKREGIFRACFNIPAPPALPDRVRQSSSKAKPKRTSEGLVLCIHGAGLLCSEFENPEQFHRTVDGRLISGVV